MFCDAQILRRNSKLLRHPVRKLLTLRAPTSGLSPTNVEALGSFSTMSLQPMFIVYNKGAPSIFHWAKTKGRQRGWGYWGWGSKLPPHQLRVWGETVGSTAWFGAESRLPTDFPLFSALNMASPDTIILVDYRAAFGMKTPVPLPFTTPLVYKYETLYHSSTETDVRK